MTTASATLPSPTISRRAIEDALSSWLATSSGLPGDRVWWQDQGVARTTFPFATLSWLSSISEGTDSLVTEDLGPPQVGIADIRQTATGLRRVVVSVQVFGDAKTAPEHAPAARLEAALTRLSLETVSDALRVAGFAVVTTTGSRHIGPGQFSAEVTGYISSSVSEDLFSIQSVVFDPQPELDDMIEAFTADGAGATLEATAYVGSSAVVIDTEAEVLSLLTAEVVATYPHTFDVVGGGGEFVWLVIPSSQLVDTFDVNGFVGGFVLIISGLSVAGVACDVWRTVQPGLGSFAVEAS